MSAPDLSRGLHVGAEPQLRAAPDVLLPYQQRWVADKSRLKVAEKSRRIGLSWAEAADDALHAASASGSNVYYMSYEMSMTRQFIEDCAWWAKWFNLAAGEMYEDVWRDDVEEHQVFRIDFASGWHIQALSSAPRNLRSKQGRAVFDEYAFTDPAKQAELLKAGLAFLIWGGDVRVISTHDGVTNGFNVLVQEIREKRRPGSVHRITFDEAIREGLYRRIAMLKGLDPSPEAEAAWAAEVRAFYGEGASEELDVVPSQSGGRYLPRVLVEQCLRKEIPVVRYQLPDEFALRGEAERVAEVDAWCQLKLAPLLERADPALRSHYGMDFARSGHLSVMIPGQTQPDLVRRALFVLELRNVPFEQQRQITFFIADRLPRFASGAHDAGGNGAYLAEVAAQRYGADRIHQVKLNPSWYLANFPRYKAGLEDRKVELPADADVLDDHSDVTVVNGVPLVPKDGERKGADNLLRHGDSAVAGVLWWFASEQDGPAAPLGAATPYSSAPQLSRGGSLLRPVGALLGQFRQMSRPPRPR